MLLANKLEQKAEIDVPGGQSHNEALEHLRAELGPKLGVAISRMLRNPEKTSGQSPLERLIAEAEKQLSGMEVKRDKNGKIITGLLDLTKFGLTTSEIDEIIGIERSSDKGFKVGDKRFTIGDVRDGAYAKAVIEHREAEALGSFESIRTARNGR